MEAVSRSSASASDQRDVRHGAPSDLRNLRRVRRAVLDWYATAHRDFPWRRTRDPYAVLVSEVMLQQTQAARVAERFPAFLERFPTAAALAAASDAQVLAAWSGLGYNRRAIALKRAAAQVAVAGWPRVVSELERLPGIGPYTARAIASLAFGEPVGVVDTNVRRWLVRRFGLDPTRADGALPAALQALADALAGASVASPEGDEAAAWTHATMELGAAVCTSRRPACEVCPIAAGCPSRGRTVMIPVPRQATFAGSSRAWRGAILRIVAAAPDHQLPRAALEGELLHRDTSTPQAPALLSAALIGLEREGLIHRHESLLRLGGPDGATPDRGADDAPGAAATIGR
jgi:A/G-specific adenine glycosylase